MKKNVSGQFVGASLVNTAGASVTTGTTSVWLTIDNGTQATASSTASHKGNGYWSLIPTQAETNGDHIAYTFVNSGAISATIQMYPGDVTPTLVFSGNPTTAAGLTVTLPTTSTTNSQVGNLVGVASGVGYGQWRPITGWTTTTTSRTLTIASAWEVTPTTASTLVISGFGITPINGDSAGNAVVGSFSATATAQIAGTTIALVTRVITLDTVSSISAGAFVTASAVDGFLTAAKIAPNAISASELAAEAVTKIAAGVWADSSAAALVRAQVTGALTSDVYVLPTAGLSSSNTILQYLRLSTHMAMAPRSSSTTTETVMNFTGSAALFTASVTYTTASATATRALFA